MHVIDHEPHAWFLLGDGDRLFLDAHCSHSFFDYSVLIELDETEISAFRADGREYLHKLAYDIHYSAPAARESRSPFKARNLTVKDNPLNDAAHAAIMAWRKSQMS